MTGEKNGQSSLCERVEPIIFGVGCSLFLLGVSFIVSDCLVNVVRSNMQHELIVTPNSTALAEWVRPSGSNYVKFYVFNVTNADAIIRGEKPVLTENGPYTYRTFSPRFDIEFFSNKTVAFRSRHTLYFERGMSIGSDDEIYHHVNVPRLTMYRKQMKQEDDDDNSAWAKNEGLIVAHSVKEIIFGYKIQTLDISKNAGGLRSHSCVGCFKNNTSDGLYLVNTGESNFADHNTIQRWNGNTHLTYWATEYANMINGTYGQFVKPNVRKSEHRFIYVPPLRRSVKLEYENPIETDGVYAFRYHFSSDLLANATAVPDNAGFCASEIDCLESGLLYVGKYENATTPLFVSLPHFFNGDERLCEDVVGLNPNKSSHDSFFDIEPTTGAIFHSRLRLQISVYLGGKNLPAQLDTIRPAYVPLFWLSDEATIGNNTAPAIIRNLYDITLASIGEYIVLAVSVAWVLWIVGIMLRRRCRCGVAGTVPEPL